MVRYRVMFDEPPPCVIRVYLQEEHPRSTTWTAKQFVLLCLCNAVACSEYS